MLLKGIKTTNTIGSPDYWAAQCQAQGEAPGGHYLYNNGTELVFVATFHGWGTQSTGQWHSLLSAPPPAVCFSDAQNRLHSMMPQTPNIPAEGGKSPLMDADMPVKSPDQGADIARGLFQLWVWLFLLWDHEKRNTLFFSHVFCLCLSNRQYF